MLTLQQENRDERFCCLPEWKNISALCLLQRLAEHEGRGQRVAFEEAMNDQNPLKAMFSSIWFDKLWNLLRGYEL